MANLCINPRIDPLHCGQDCQNLRPCATDELCIDGQCQRYEVPIACNACPCACGGNMCCSYPGATNPICVDARCP
jgi:hypothetical protein